MKNHEDAANKLRSTIVIIILFAALLTPIMFLLEASTGIQFECLFALGICLLALFGTIKISNFFRSDLRTLPWLQIVGITLVTSYFTYELMTILSFLFELFCTKKTLASLFSWHSLKYYENLSLYRITGTIIITPLVEELFWRGYMLRWLAQRLDIRKAVLITSLFDAVWHFDGLNMIGHFVAFLVLALLYVQTQNLFVPIICHIALNTIAEIGNLASYGRLAPWVSDILTPHHYSRWMALIVVILTTPLLVIYFRKHWPRTACKWVTLPTPK